MDAVLRWIDESRARYQTELADWAKIPAISSDPAHAVDVKKNAEHLAKRLSSLGAGTVEIWDTPGHPAVFAEWNDAPGKPTLLIYGHHDVQPIDPIDEWVSPPFEPTIREGRMWGRGVVDDKGQVLIHVNAIEAMRKANGKLPINIKLIVEGEEEVGSVNLDALMRDKSKQLQADFVCVSDTAMFGRGIPSLCVGLRGLMYLEVEVTSSTTDLHSGSFGGGVANPVNVLARMIASLHDDDGHIAVPGFYAKVVELTEKERKEIQDLPFDEKEWLSMAGAKAPHGEKGFSTLERVWARPTLDCNGIGGGFQGEGAKTIVPSKASAKISARLVPHQEPEEIAALVIDHLKNGGATLGNREGKDSSRGKALFGAHRSPRL